jgi:hypothetical protein
LEQVGADEGGEPEPVYTVKLAQSQAAQDKRSCDQSNHTFARHGFPSALAEMVDSTLTQAISNQLSAFS